MQCQSPTSTVANLQKRPCDDVPGCAGIVAQCGSGHAFLSSQSPNSLNHDGIHL